jgi:hypothetical protein
MVEKERERERESRMRSVVYLGELATGMSNVWP